MALNTVSLLLTAILFFLVPAILIFRFRKKLKNFYISVAEHKKFVVVHVKNPATRFTETYNVVPNFEGTTEVNGLPYCLRKDNYLIEWKKRLHYLVDKNDAMPKTVSDRTVKDIILSVYQIRSTIRSKAYDILYGDKKNWAFIIACLALIISILIAIYTLYTLNHINPLLDAIYSKIQPSQIEIKPGIQIGNKP